MTTVDEDPEATMTYITDLIRDILVTSTRSFEELEVTVSSPGHLLVEDPGGDKRYRLTIEAV